MSNHAQSYRDVFVINNPALLTSGDSTDLAIGQLGIFNYDPKKDRTATGSPNYQFNKFIQFIAGTPPVPTNLLGAVADQSKASKPFNGRAIKSFTGRAAERGQTQIVAVGYDGFDTSKTLFAKCEEHKTVFLKLSGGPIDQAFHTEGRGYVRQYSVFSGCCDDCGDDCAQTSALRMAEDLVNQINHDPLLSLGTATNNPYVRVQNSAPTNQLVRASVIQASAPATPDATALQWLLYVCDAGDSVSLGAVQAQYPGYQISAINRQGSTTTYQLILASTLGIPAAFNDANSPVIVDCPTCPSGYTLVDSMSVTKITRMDAGNGAALTTLLSDYDISGSGQTAFRLIYTYGQSTYIATTIAPITVAVGTDVVQTIGQTRNSCVISAPVNIPWQSGNTYNAYNATWNITLEDNVCGNSRLSELQRLYPSFTIVDNGAGAGNLCVHNYQTTVLSAFTGPGCPPDAPLYTPPDPFFGIPWHLTFTASTGTTAVGVAIESAYVDLVTNECAYMYWKYDAEPVFITVSQHQQDYNERPTICAGDWAVTEVQNVKLPIGVGSQVRDVEIYYKGYERKFWDENPIVRQYQDSLVQADPLQYYDMFTIAFDFSYHITWFAQKETDSYRVEVYIPQGKGGQFQEAMNAYVASIDPSFEPVAIV